MLIVKRRFVTLFELYGEPSSVIRNGLLNMHIEQKYREGKDEKNGSNRVKGVETKSKQALGALKSDKVPFV